MGRDDLQYIDPVLRHVGGEAVGVVGALRGDQVQAVARAQRAEQHGVAEVGGHGGDHCHARAGAQV
ncbi:hypothetical protein D3C78_539380 [compost metagenome]